MKIKVWNTIQQLSKERGVEESVIVSAIKESLRVAAAQYFTNEEKVDILFTPEKGDLRVFASKKVSRTVLNPAVEIGLSEARKIDPAAEPGQTIEVDLPSDTLGRIAAQAAKQVIYQKVRTAEQEKIFEQFHPRLGEVATGVLRRTDVNNNLILDLNKVEVCLPWREKLKNDDYIRGDRVRAVIHQVTRDDINHQVILSRTSPKLLRGLLEMEIPEIADGLIEIKDICRQAGERSKVAVSTQDEKIDPVGACIGVQGHRILAISKELKGEKIDIVVYSDDPAAYAKSALSPARPSHVAILDKVNKVLQAEVPTNQLSLAIGKKGLNVRLASRLTGWKIDIIPEGQESRDRSQRR